jgi:hypothetical protein
VTLFLVVSAGAQAPPPAATLEGGGTGGGASALYLRLRSVGLDPARVYRIREATIDREDLHVSIEDGTIAFLQAIDGHVTGAFFTGSGDVLLNPPNRVERTSLSLFTGSAILEENFTSAFFRFNDDTAAELKPFLRPAEDTQEFVNQWDSTVRNLSSADALRLVASALNTPQRPEGAPSYARGTDHLLRMRVEGEHLGVFDVIFDSEASEPISVGGLAIKDGVPYFDLWTSFATSSMRKAGVELSERADVGQYRIQATVTPPQRLSAVAEVTLTMRTPGQRVLFFQLSRFLKVTEVDGEGHPLEFLQNDALEGSALARNGDDLIGVVFPQAPAPGTKLTLKFTYSGDVLGDAGGGLLYVGARGDWYPSRGMQMSHFDLEFRYPEKWTLVATGKQEGEEKEGEQRVAHWVSERAMPLAGFNVGRYERSTAKAGPAEVDVYAAPGVEAAFHRASSPDMVPDPFGQPMADMSIEGRNPVPRVVPAPPPAPEPQRNAERMANSAARALQIYAKLFGPYPYSRLALSQNPGHSSQGWPGLVFLSSYAFLSVPERSIAHLSPWDELVYRDFMQLHETAHQWWGDLIVWRTYRDQWLLEALANYSALMVLEQPRPGDVHQILEHYRDELAAKQPNGESIADAGPVTLGGRLNSSHFPRGFDAVSYGRGTWLLHMLRMLMKDASEPPRHGGRLRNAAEVSSEEPFLRGLRVLRQRFEGSAISTGDFVRIMAEQLPPAARYEGKPSLDWFLDGWVNGNSLPSFTLDDVKFARKSSGRVASGTVVEGNAPPDLVTPVPVYAVTTAGRNVYLGRVWADSEKTSFHLPVPADTRKLVLDPFQTILTHP